MRLSVNVFVLKTSFYVTSYDTSLCYYFAFGIIDILLVDSSSLENWCCHIWGQPDDSFSKYHKKTETNFTAQ